MGKILTLNDAIKSDYGEDMHDFRNMIDHPLRLEEVQLELVDSTFSISPKMAKEIEVIWKEIKNNDSDLFDEPKLRFENVRFQDGRLIIGLSSGISYSEHRVMRDETLDSVMDYPTPMTVDNLQETSDGYVLFGKVSNQPVGSVVGAGFHDPIIGKKGIIHPGCIFRTALREASEETEYFDGNTKILGPVYKNSMRMIGLVLGSRNSMTAVIYMPLKTTSDNIDLNRNNKEYDSLYTIKNSNDNLDRILRTGNLEGVETREGSIGYNIPLIDHSIGVVESFLRFRDSLPRNCHQH